MTLPNWSSRPEPSDERPPAPKKPSRMTLVAERLGGYVGELLIYVGMVAFMGYILMLGVGIMHHEFWLVPALSYVFCASFVWTTSALVVWYYTITTRGEQ